MGQGYRLRSRRWVKWQVLFALLITAYAGVTAGLAGAAVVDGDLKPQALWDAEGMVADAPQAPLAPVLIHSEDFEGATFPPNGWTLVDAWADNQDPPMPPQYVWSAESCDLYPGRGGGQAAWAVGGGALGSGLSCGAPYPDMVDSYLLYLHIDATSFAGGLQVTLDYKLDEPRQQSFLVCAYEPSVGYRCFASPVSQTDWRTFGPMHFGHVAGLQDVELWIWYKDRDPDGTHVGVFVDNVVIEGLTDAMTSTPTNTILPTTPTTTATTALPATGTMTALPSPTSTPSPTPTTTLSPTVTVLPTLTPTPTQSPTTGASPSATSTATLTAQPGESPTPTSTTEGTQPPTATSSSTATSLPPTDTPPATDVATEPPTPTGTLGPTMPPPETSVPTDTSTPTTALGTPTTTLGTPTGATPSETPEPGWRIYAPFVARGLLN